MKQLKKLAGLLLALTMVIGLTATAFAATDPTAAPTPTPNPMQGELSGGSITINNAVADQIYRIYQILYLESYNAGSNAYSYKANSQWENWLNSDATDYVSIDGQGYVTWKQGANAAEFAKDALEHAEDANIQPNAAITAVDTSITFDNLRLGYYLVDSTLGTLCSLDTTNPEVEMHEKNAKPSNEKEVLEDSVTAPDDPYGKVNDADIGQTVNFRSKVTLPAGSENVTYHDTMSKGLTFNENSVSVVEYTSTGLGDAEVITEGKALTVNVDYEVKTNVEHDGKTCTFEVVFKKSYLDTPIGTGETDRTEKVLIKYNATVNENAVIGDIGNTNESHLSYGDEGNTQVTPPSTTTTYVWEFDIFKWTATPNTENPTGDPIQTPLAGAQFVLLTKDANQNDSKVAIFDENHLLTGWQDVPEAVDGVITWPDGAILETPANGTINVEGLDSGTYYLREIKAPAGYNMLAEDKEVSITPTEGENGGLTLTTPVTVDVENKTGSELPGTGGIGTTIFYVVGSILLVGAVVLLIVKKRMSVTK